MSHQLLLELSLGLNGDDAFLLNFVLIIDFKPSPKQFDEYDRTSPYPRVLLSYNATRPSIVQEHT